MKRIKEFKETSNRSIYNKLHKILHAGCCRCRWNRGCNRQYFGIERSWKKFRLKKWKEN